MRRLTGLLAPYCPHLTEEIYRNLRCSKDPESIHLLDWNAGDTALVNTVLEGTVAIVRSFDEASQNARQSGKRKLRWPVAEVVVVTSSDAVKNAIGRLNAVCMDRANARKVSVIMGRWDRVGWHAEPVMKTLGKDFGKNSFKVKGLIEAADGNTIKAAIDTGKTYMLGSGSETFEIGADHVTFTEKLPADIFSAPMTDATVYVDVALTPDLEAEGYAREVIRRIQDMRKQLDLIIDDFITVDVQIKDDRIYSLLNQQKIGLKIVSDMIADEVRSTGPKGGLLSFLKENQKMCDHESIKDWDIEGIPMTIGISKVG
jgi:isoleucyl-tRNA synthetase